VNLLGQPFLSSFWLIQILDIALITYLVWLLLRAIWDLSAMRVIIAVVLVWGASVLLNSIGFYSIGLITEKLAPIIIFALIVIFSKEVKDILARLGRFLSALSFLDFKHRDSDNDKLKSLDAVLETCDYLREKGYGGLMVLERQDKVLEFCEGFSEMNVPVSAGILKSFLTPPGPYHDGAIVINGDKIIRARAFLFPPGADTIVLGTRHRAAKGLAERTDAVVVVVSEETRKIRVAYDRKLNGPYSMESLREKLYMLMRSSAEKDKR
jgi:diadenylate cyclase